MAIGDVIQLSVNQDVHGVSMANVYHFIQLNAEGAGERPEIEIMLAWNETLALLQSVMSVAAWEQECLTARVVRPVGGIQFINTTNVAGIAPGNGLGAGTCCVGRLYSEAAIKRGRGRKFLPGVPQNVHNLGRLTAAGHANLVMFLQQLLLTLQKAGGTVQFALVIISSLDALIRTVIAALAWPTLTKLSSRKKVLC